MDLGIIDTAIPWLSDPTACENDTCYCQYVVWISVLDDPDEWGYDKY